MRLHGSLKSSFSGPHTARCSGCWSRLSPACFEPSVATSDTAAKERFPSSNRIARPFHDRRPPANGVVRTSSETIATTATLTKTPIAKICNSVREALPEGATVMTSGARQVKQSRNRESNSQRPYDRTGQSKTAPRRVSTYRPRRAFAQRLGRALRNKQLCDMTGIARTSTRHNISNLWPTTFESKAKPCSPFDGFHRVQPTPMSRQCRATTCEAR